MMQIRKPVALITAYVCMYVCMYVCVYVSASLSHLSLHMYVCMNVCMQIRKPVALITVFTCKKTNILRQTKKKQVNLREYVCMYVCIYVCMYANPQACRAYYCICMYVCMYACMYVCKSPSLSRLALYSQAKKQTSSDKKKTETLISQTKTNSLLKKGNKKGIIYIYIYII
jgi:hypothetical protein